MKEDARKGARGARRKPRPFVSSGSCRRVRHAVWHVQKTPQRSMPVEMPCGRLRTGQAHPSRKGRLFAALRRSGRDALVASGLRDVPGGTRFRIDMHCSEVKSRTWSYQGHKGCLQIFVADVVFLLDLRIFRMLSLLRTEFSFSPYLPQPSLRVSPRVSPRAPC